MCHSHLYLLSLCLHCVLQDWRRRSQIPLKTSPMTRAPQRILFEFHLW
uniref:Uncharacterized protein n=1 Tax=Rhizophora mucronata TaxID=61149 RepID=A0A2P2Q9P6_RHIMU